MKTKCYCIFCKNHPLYNSNIIDWKTGWDVGDFIESKYESTSAEVECLSPESNAFNELEIEPTDIRFPITAYGDGYAVTGFEGNGFTIYAFCEDEEHEEL